MPYDKDANGESIFLTPYQHRIKYEEFAEPDGSINKDKFVDGSWKPGRSPASKASQFKKGNRLGGRQKGARNKKTIIEQAKELGMMTGAEFLLQVVNDATVNLNQRIAAAEKVAKFGDPALSSVELHTDEDNESPFKIILADTEKAKDIVESIRTEDDNDKDD